MAKFEYAPAPESRAVVEHPPVIRAVHRRRVRAVHRRVDVQDDQPVLRGGPGRGHRGRRGRRRPGCAGGPQGLRRAVGSPVRRRTGQVPLPYRAHPAGARAGVRRPGEPGQRQADQGAPRRRHPAGCGALLLPRRLGRQARATPGCRADGTTAETAGRRRPGDPVELPAAHAVVEDRAGPGRAATPWSSSRPRPHR